LAVVARDQRDTMTACRLFDESIAVRRAIGDRHGLALTLANLADVVRQQGDYDSANALLAESLATDHELGAAPRIAFLLECLAGVSADQGRAARALRLAGAAAALRAAIGAAPTPAAQAVLEQRLAPAHRALDLKSGAQAWSEGQALVLDEAVAYGLGGAENLTEDEY
ncbi:MAG: tetratricopeptide repeat protein, partial [Chloroflexota bacterium]|nr:tetratricopeptide repeat protein [Chloroflexota bacterium]